MERVVLQVEERAAAGVRHTTRAGRDAMWGAGMVGEGRSERAAKRN